MATHSSILAREIPWTDEPGGCDNVTVHEVTKSRIWLSDNTRQQILIGFMDKVNGNVNTWSCSDVTGERVDLSGEIQRGEEMKTEEDFAKGKAEESILNGSDHMWYPTTNTTFPSRIFIQFNLISMDLRVTQANYLYISQKKKA